MKHERNGELIISHGGITVIDTYDVQYETK
jgi:hypothetical protein